MKCEAVLDRYTELDKYETLPIGIRVHLLHCRKCKKIIEKMEAAESVQHCIPAGRLDNGSRLLEATMNKIYLHGKNYTFPCRQKEQPDMLSWLTAGLILIAGFIILPFSEIGKSGMQQFGNAFSIPFALLCAGSVVVYAGVFIAKNIAFFTEKFDLTAAVD
ncbi:MAG: hypothetical protein P1P65_03925 [Treponema sp.]